MTVSKKAVCSFILSALLLAGVVVLCHTGSLNLPVKIAMFIAVFAALFLVFFFCLSVRQDKEVVSPLPALSLPTEAFDLEEIAAGPGATVFRGLFDFAPHNPALLAGAETDIIYEYNGIHYINGDAVNDDKSRTGKLDSHFVELIEAVAGGA